MHTIYHPIKLSKKRPGDEASGINCHFYVNPWFRGLYGVDLANSGNLDGSPRFGVHVVQDCGVGSSGSMEGSVMGSDAMAWEFPRNDFHLAVPVVA